MILLGLYILLIDGYPFFVKQRRVGLHGEPFNMFKFRTMKKNSHELRATMEELNKSDGPLFKIEQDPRILKGLSFARKFSIDELLQFINVLKVICQLLAQDHCLMMTHSFLIQNI